MITAYHRVNPWYEEDALTVFPGNFERQLRYLINRRFRPVLPEEYLANYTMPSVRCRMLLTTFDDGYADNMWHAMPVFKILGITPLIFLTVNYVGTGDIFKRYSDREKDRFLNWREVRDMSVEDAVFGSHSLSHPHLPRVDDAALAAEVSDSKKAIEDRTGRQIDFFCYPFGDFDERVIDAVRNAGYKGAVVTPGAAKRTVKGVYTMQRTGIYGHNSFNTFRIKIWKDYLTEKYF